MKKILAILAVFGLLISLAWATSAPAAMTQTTPTTASPAKLITWTALTAAAPLKFNVSSEGFQTLLIIANNTATITIPKGIGQRAPLGDLTYNVSPTNIYAFKLETSRFEQNNGTIVVDTSATVTAGVVNLHPLFY